MSKSYSQVVQQIEVLKAEAEKLRKKEVDDVIKRIKDAIKVYGLTAADLGLASRAPRAAKAAGRRLGKGRAGKAAQAQARYRDDKGNSWVGRGKRPQWLRDALAAGKTLQDFAVA
jgi:DNA-binding protein H-NS